MKDSSQLFNVYKWIDNHGAWQYMITSSHDNNCVFYFTEKWTRYNPDDREQHYGNHILSIVTSNWQKITSDIKIGDLITEYPELLNL